MKRTRTPEVAAPRRGGRRVKRRLGVASVEYATLLALVSAASLGAVSTLGSSAQGVLEQVHQAIQNSPEEPPLPVTHPMAPPAP